MATHRVIIVGGGFGGLFAARYLRRAPVQVTLIDRTNHHLFQPLLYQVATGLLSQGTVAPPLRETLRRHRNVQVELAEVTAIDVQARQVTAIRPDAQELVLDYDSLVVSAGAGQSYFGHDEFARWAPGMKTIDDALELRSRIFGAFELAETEPNEAARRAWLTFAVVGGGPTGVEIAGQIAELSRRALVGEFRTIDPRSSRVLLLEGGPEILATFGDRLSDKGRRELERIGVEIHTGSIVSEVDARSVVVKRKDGEERIDCMTKIWAAGVQASPLARLLAEATGATCDRAGRIEVLPDCTLPGHQEVFAVGDMMALDDLPGVAEVALQSGIHAAHAITRRVSGTGESKPFRYRDLGSMAAIGRFRCIVSFRGVRLSGFPGWVIWAFVHLTFLTGFGNRILTVFRWSFGLVGRQGSERTITVRQATARIRELGEKPVEEGGPARTGSSG
jgi:NADH:ubiquinone reductase (H+-translocating)